MYNNKKEEAYLNKLPHFWASCRIRTNDPEITNHVLWPTELKRQVGKLTTSRRYNQVPLLRSSPGGFRGSMPCRTYPGAKVDIIFYKTSVFLSGKWYLFLSGCNPFVFCVVKKCLGVSSLFLLANKFESKPDLSKHNRRDNPFYYWAWTEVNYFYR